jgi:hypothetical protein
VVVLVVVVEVVVDVDVVERLGASLARTLAVSSDELPLKSTADVDAPAIATTNAPPTSQRRTLNEPTLSPLAPAPRPELLRHPGLIA